MGRRLATAVHIEHPKTHKLLILQPGEEPDEDVSEAITNPYAWGEEREAPTLDDPEPEAAPEPEPAPEKPAARTRSRKATGEQ